MSWKTNYRSFYYQGAPEPDDIVLDPAETALLVVDIQGVYLVPSEDAAQRDAWAPFRERMNDVVIPNVAKLIDKCRSQELEVMFARIACLKDNGRDRSLSQKKPGWNYLLLPKDAEESSIVPELQPQGDEIVFCKTTDSALTGTNMRLILQNMGIKNVIVVGIFTDQCISSTVRSLADESFNVVVVEDCCAAATKELHDHELEIINMIYCHVVSSDEVVSFLKPQK
ncbi:isochorismatase family cysteine hydrolase [Paenochrobactrum glaciei]|uniref:Cysteine hydrolase n=1 Tax=Paenochrobactrum glaciei TaxID=486407 RepID=A0ABP3RR23_9HYPH